MLPLTVFAHHLQIMEARGNGPSYGAQGSNFVRSSLNYGVLESLQTHIFGWWSQKQSSFDRAFHTYSLEWTPDWMRFYVDSRLQAMMNLKITGKGGKDFFRRGEYPDTATNGSDVAVVISDIWEKQGGSAAAPFDQGEPCFFGLRVWRRDCGAALSKLGWWWSFGLRWLLRMVLLAAGQGFGAPCGRECVQLLTYCVLFYLCRVLPDPRRRCGRDERLVPGWRRG